MRQSVLIALALAFATAAAAVGQEPWKPEFVEFTNRRDIAAAVPKAAREKKTGGEVVLDCVAAEDGRLVNCAVAEEEPIGLGFGEAALKLVLKERIKPTDGAGLSVAGRRVKSHFLFPGPGYSDVDWLKKPTPEDLAAAYPTAAVNKGVDGRAMISCDVTVEGFLQNCETVSEQPAGLGFGSAALQLSPQFRMKPKMRAGKAVRGSVNIPVNWSDVPQLPPSETGGPRLVLDPPWVAVPTAEAVAAAWPKNARTAKAGQAVLRCRLTAEGSLRDCEEVSEIPADHGFGRAAMALSKSFKVRFAPEQSKDLKDYYIDVPFRFRAPTEPDSRAITSPKWIRLLTPESVEAVFPQAARDAGVFSGLAVINCAVNAQGDLGGCEVRREDPVGMGFGAAAILAAGKLRLNPWSKEGDPLDGLRFSLPMRIEVDPPATPAPAP